MLTKASTRQQQRGCHKRLGTCAPFAPDQKLSNWHLPFEIHLMLEDCRRGIIKHIGEVWQVLDKTWVAALTEFPNGEPRDGHDAGC